MSTAATADPTPKGATIPLVDFDATLDAHALPGLAREEATTLQVNIGLRCNLACHHCHVESGPKRDERLDRRGVERLVELVGLSPRIQTVDITGGAPEMHPDFRFLVREVRALGRRVIDRCNLTILHEPGQADTAEFLADQGVDIVASLPCYSLENVERQRGRGVFDGSLRALQQLNALGYGQSRTSRVFPADALAPGRLDLVYNPTGASLPPSQESLESDYREVLERDFGIRFDELLTITNMPIKRFAHALLRDGHYYDYMDLLVANFNATTVPGLMCRHQLSVGHDGRIFDCDFNQALSLDADGGPITIFDIEDLSALDGRAITTASHCFGCTAGSGSSCGGAITRGGEQDPAP